MFFKKRLRLYLYGYLLFIFVGFNNIYSVSEWTTLVYVQARNNLNKFAARNLTAMSKIGSNKNSNILVQWYQPNKSGIWRYKINKNKIELDSHIPSNTDGNRVDDLVDSMRWAASKYGAKKYALILWNHGVGILDPTWGRLHSYGLGMDFDDLNGNPRMQIEDLTVSHSNDKLEFDQVDDECLTNYSNLIKEQDSFMQRGILFNEYSRTYMKNGELIEALSKIKQNVLNNKKIDVFGMDACLMAMVEMAYQVRDFAKYMVASQEVELAYGWDYKTVLSGLSHGNLSPLDLAKSIVLSYQSFYKNRIKFYTQSAVDLEGMNYITESLDSIINDILECKKHDNTAIRSILTQARNKSTQFSVRNYIDLYSFYSNIISILESTYKVKNGNILPASLLHSNAIFKNEILQLYRSLKLGLGSIENTVLAYTAGESVRGARGLSIYFPNNPATQIDASYATTEFAQNTKWLSLLRTYFAK